MSFWWKELNCLSKRTHRDLAGAGECKGNSRRSAKLHKILFVPSLIYRKRDINLLLRDDCGSDSGKSFAVKIIIKLQ